MQRKLAYTGVLIALIVLTLSFQNCGADFFTAEQVFSKNCIPGKKLGIWLDPGGTGLREPQNYLGSIVAFKGELTSVENFNYYSYSAHPQIGPTPTGWEAHVYFYEGPDGLSLNFYANIDAGGSKDNTFNWDIQISDNQLADSVLLSDDNGELKQLAPQGNSHLYEGRFHYWSNTDGGVIGPLVGDDYIVQVQVQSTGDIRGATFYSSNNQSFALHDDQNNISSFLIAYEEYETCGLPN